MQTLNKRNQEKKALLIGFALILLVVLIVFTRPMLKKNGATEDSKNKIIPSAQISFSELQDKMRNKADLQIIDVRSSDYYEAEHIIDSMNIPLEALREINLGSDFNKLIVILDQGADSNQSRESQAVQIIKGKGFKNVVVFQGGMLSWKSNEGPTISVGDPNSFIDSSKVTFISPEELEKNIGANSFVYILDVRQSSDFSSGHIKNAINIPLDDLEKRKDELSMDKLVVVYAETALESFQAGVRLYDLNFYSVRALQGGFSAWKDKNFEIVK